MLHLKPKSGFSIKKKKKPKKKILANHTNPNTHATTPYRVNPAVSQCIWTLPQGSEWPAGQSKTSELHC